MKFFHTFRSLAALDSPRSNAAVDGDAVGSNERPAPMLVQAQEIIVPTVNAVPVVQTHPTVIKGWVINEDGIPLWHPKLSSELKEGAQKKAAKTSTPFFEVPTLTG